MSLPSEFLFCIILLPITRRRSDRKHDKCALEPTYTWLFIPWSQWYVQLAWLPKLPIADKFLKGAIYAIISYFACRQPFATFFLFAIVPIPAWAFVPGILLYDVYEMTASNKVRIKTMFVWLYGLYIFWMLQTSRVDTASHVGGIFAGIAYFLSRRAGIRL